MWVTHGTPQIKKNSLDLERMSMQELIVVQILDHLRYKKRNWISTNHILIFLRAKCYYKLI